jgi:hypothetical protein
LFASNAAGVRFETLKMLTSCPLLE